jgi:hypothetical protein
VTSKEVKAFVLASLDSTGWLSRAQNSPASAQAALVASVMASTNLTRNIVSLSAWSAVKYDAGAGGARRLGAALDTRNVVYANITLSYSVTMSFLAADTSNMPSNDVFAWAAATQPAFAARLTPLLARQNAARASLAAAADYSTLGYGSLITFDCGEATIAASVAACATANGKQVTGTFTDALAASLGAPVLDSYLPAALQAPATYSAVVTQSQNLMNGTVALASPTPTATPSPTPSPAVAGVGGVAASGAGGGARVPSSGEIAGGVVGGLVGAAILVFIAYTYMARQKASATRLAERDKFSLTIEDEFTSNPNELFSKSQRGGSVRFSTGDSPSGFPASTRSMRSDPFSREGSSPQLARSGGNSPTYSGPGRMHSMRAINEADADADSEPLPRKFASALSSVRNLGGPSLSAGTDTSLGLHRGLMISNKSMNNLSSTVNMTSNPLRAGKSSGQLQPGGHSGHHDCGQLAIL